jgi:hypothetical protein
LRCVNGELVRVIASRVVVVPLCRPGGKDEKQPRRLQCAHRVRLARFEDDERALHAGRGVCSTCARHAPPQDLDQRSLANLVVAHLLVLRKIDHNATCFWGREENSRTRSASLVRCCQVPMLHVGNTSEPAVDRCGLLRAGVEADA